MSVFELISELSLIFGKECFSKHFKIMFMDYLNRDIALVRKTGVEKSGALAKAFGEDWIITQYIPVVTAKYNEEG